MCPDFDTILSVFDVAPKAAIIFQTIYHHEKIKNSALCSWNSGNFLNYSSIVTLSLFLH
jgi:hypothetical protein